MKLLVFCMLTVAMVGIVHAAPQDVQLLRYESKNDGLGTYSFTYELSDGTSREEMGELRNAGSPNEFVAVSGSYSWIGPDNVKYDSKYVADENGYQVLSFQGPYGRLPPAVAALLFS